MEHLSHDVLIIGGGAAGLRAAIAAAELNPKLDIAIVSKVYPMRSHTVSAEGGMAAVLRTDYDNFDLHAYDTIKGSDFLADQDAVEFFVKEAPKESIRLEHWGCPFSRDPDGRISAGLRRNERKKNSVCHRQDWISPSTQSLSDELEVREYSQI